MALGKQCSQMKREVLSSRKDNAYRILSQDSCYGTLRLEGRI